MIAECMEQVIRGFLPWESIAKKYFNEQQDDDESESEEKPKGVSFGDDVDDSDDDDEDEDKPDIHVGEEEGTIEFEDLDKKQEVVAIEPKADKDVDPLAEIEGKIGGETLVLNL
jgi:hypothetical protein